MLKHFFMIKSDFSLLKAYGTVIILDNLSMESSFQ